MDQETNHESIRLKDIERVERILDQHNETGRLCKILVNLTGRELDEVSIYEYNRSMELLEKISTKLCNYKEDVIERNLENHNEIICELINQALSALGLESISKEFYDCIVYDSVTNNYYQYNSKGEVLEKKSKKSFLDLLEDCVELFRIFSMYNYGDFKHPFRLFRKHSIKELKEKWTQLYIPTEIQIKEDIVGFQDIDSDLRWCLGYLAGQYGKIVELNRSQIKPYLETYRKRNCLSMADCESTRKIFTLSYLYSYLPPDADFYDGALSESEFKAKLDQAIRICEKPVTERIQENMQKGRLNTLVYLSIPEIDVYFATSMRRPDHFYNASRIINEIFNTGELDGKKLRIFDPTNAFSHDRLDKGIIECLMVNRSKITLYNAQEIDSFGKDVEAALSLIIGHPVIVYVARLFSKHLNDLYDDIDFAQQCNDTTYLKFILPKLSWDDKQKNELKKEPYTKGKLIRILLSDKLREKMDELDETLIKNELMFHGYPYIPEMDLEDIEKKEKTLFINKEDLIEHIIPIIINLESRALVFLEGHPLSMLTSPYDGVARGVIITRTIKQTRKMIKKLLSNNVNYKIVRDAYCWKLHEIETNSPIRVVTADNTLSSAFWDTFIDT